MNQAEFTEWYQTRRQLYEELAASARLIIEIALKNEGIPYLAVVPRAKTVESAATKVSLKGYAKPEKEMTDLAGVRVIAYTDEAVKRVCALIEKAFAVDQENSENKSTALETYKLGYRSHHYVCEMDPARLELVEFRKFNGLVFEIQVRTALQHAWAEIAHSREYKFVGELPPELKRQLYLIAGVLEVADNQISSLAKNIDLEREAAARRLTTDPTKELGEAGITALAERIVSKAPNLHLTKPKDGEFYETILREVHRFGINDLEGLEALVTEDFITAAQKHLTNITPPGLIRDLLMFSDLKRYLKRSRTMVGSFVFQTTYKFLCEKYRPLDVQMELKEALMLIAGIPARSYSGLDAVPGSIPSKKR